MIAKFYKNQAYHKAGMQVINSLLKSKKLKFTIYVDFFKSKEEADKLLEKNVFAYHPENNVVTFQSKSVEFYIQENSDIYVDLIDINDSNQATTSNEVNDLKMKSNVINTR